MTENNEPDCGYNPTKLIDTTDLSALQVHLADAVKDVDYSDSEKALLAEVRAEINYDFSQDKYDISSAGVVAAGKVHRASIQFLLNGKKLFKYLNETHKTPEELSKFFNEALKNGDLVNTQGLYTGETGYIHSRFQDPRQHGLIDEAYIGFDFEYEPEKTTQEKISYLTEENTSLKDQVNDLDTEIENLKKQVSGLANPTTTTTTDSTTDSTTQATETAETTDTTSSAQPQATVANGLQDETK